MSLQQVRVQLLNEETGEAIQDVDVLTSGESVLFEDGETVAHKLSHLTEQLANAEQTSSTQISDLIDQAPEALNTLGKLAGALDNRADFATTINEELALKATKTETETLLASKADMTIIDNLSEQINVLSSERGYTSDQSFSSDATEAVLNSITKSGKYSINYVGDDVIQAGWYTVDVTNYGETFCTQSLIGFSNLTQDLAYYRSYSNGVWTTRKLVDTTITDGIEKKIDTLSNDIRGFKIYNFVSQLGLTPPVSTEQLILAMPDKSIFIGNTTDLNDSPSAFATLNICRFDLSRVSGSLLPVSGTLQNVMHICTYHNVSLFSGWKQLATTQNTEILQEQIDVLEKRYNLIERDSFGTVSIYKIAEVSSIDGSVLFNINGVGMWGNSNSCSARVNLSSRGTDTSKCEVILMGDTIDSNVPKFYTKIEGDKFFLYMQRAAWSRRNDFETISFYDSKKDFVNILKVSEIPEGCIEVIPVKVATIKTTDIELENGWVTTGGHMKPSFKLVGNVVTVVGLITGGVVDFDTTIFSIPSNLAPVSSVPVVVHEETFSGGVARLTVLEPTRLRISNSNGPWIAGKSVNINFSYPIS